MNAIFLSGGGARGAYEIGVLKALLSCKIPIDIIGGASIGAINAVVAATGQLDDLIEVWSHLSTFKVFRPRMDVWNFANWTALLNRNSLRDRLRDEVAWDRLAHSSMQVFITATNINTRTNEVFSSSEITYRHVMASSAVPILFAPVRIGNHWYIDGGFSLLRPLKPLLKAGASRIFTIFLSPRRPRLDSPRGLLHLADRVLESMLATAIEGDVKNIEVLNQEITRLKSMKVDPAVFQHKPYRPVEVITVHPSRDLGQLTSYLNFSGSQAKELIELGKTDGYGVLKRHGLIS